MASSGDPGAHLAVIIVTFNSDAVLPGCLEALDAAFTKCAGIIADPADLVVVDNRSAERPRVADGPCRRTIQVDSDENLGFPRGVNLGLERVPDADMVLLLNPDAQLDEFALLELLREQRSHDAALVGPILVSEDGSPHGMSERPFHSLGREAVRQFAPWLQDAHPWGAAAAVTGDARCLTGACLLVDGAWLRSVGGLDTAVPMYLEDVELAWLAHAGRRTVRLASKARCAHILGGSSDMASFRTSQHLHLTLLAARVEFLRRRRGMHAAIAMRGLMALGSMCRVLLGVVTRRSELARKHAATFRWALGSGIAPQWPPASSGV